MHLLKDKIVTILAWVFGILIGIIVFSNYKKILNAITAWREGKEHDKSNVNVDLGGGESITINLHQSANEIYESFHGSFMSEDEESAMQSLLLVPKSKIKTLNMLYSAIDGKGYSIYKDFKKYLSNTEYKKVQHLLS